MKPEWNIRETDETTARDLTGRTGIHPVLSRLLASRGIRTPESVRLFLNPSLKGLRSPFEMKDMSRAVERIVKAIETREHILVFGDYDVDGITGTSLLHSFLEHAGAMVSWYIPHRVKEGYSLKPMHVDHVLVPKGISLVVTVDCGSDSVGAVKAATEKGIDVIITDHHSLSDEPPPAFALVNPKQPDCPSGLNHLAGVGVAFYLLIALRKSLRDRHFWNGRKEPNLKEACDLVALGTIADIVPLVDENRILTRVGLECINRGPRAGIKALIGVSKVNKERLNAEDIAFRIAPRLNAAGRLGHASLAFGLVSSDNPDLVRKAARDLDSMNNRRQSVEQQIVDEIEAYLKDNRPGPSEPAIVLHRQGWHIGVLGIVASRLTRTHGKPVILIALDGDRGKGSGRSVTGIDLYEALSACSKTLVGFGGHEMAGGLEIRKDQLQEFRVQFNNHIRTITAGEPIPQRLDIDCRIDLDDICSRLIDELEWFEPFGNQNPEPLFLATDIEVISSTPVGSKHRRLIIRAEKGQSDKTYMAMHFNADRSSPCPHRFNHLVFKLKWNRWNNAKSPQLIIEDFD